MNNKENTDLSYVKKINEGISNYVKDWIGQNAELDNTSAKLRKYKNSFILRVHARTGNTCIPLLVKIPRKPNHRSLDQAIQDEKLRLNSRGYYNRMISIWRSFEESRDAHCFAVRPLEFLEDWNAVVMLEVDGQTLKDMLILGAPPKTKTFLTHLENAGRWLRIYNETQGALATEEFPHEVVEAHIETMLAILAKHSNDAIHTGNMRSLLLDLVKNCEQVPVAYAHEDFKYHNVLVSTDGRVGGFDFPRRPPARKPVYADLASLVTDPETRFSTVITNRFLLTDKFLKQSRNAVLRGYFRNIPYNNDIVDFYCALVVIDKWISNEIRLSSGLFRYIGVLLLPWIRFYFSTLLKKYTRHTTIA
jgi:hypothetical protein